MHFHTFLLSSSHCVSALLIHPLLPPFDLSGCVPMGAASKEKPWSQTEGPKPGVLGELSVPRGWAERWGTDTVVCDKRMSFAANDSYRVDQLLKLRILTCIQEPWRTDSKIQSSKKKKRTQFYTERETGSCILKFCLKFQTTLPLMVGALSPICTFARWDVTELKCSSLSVETQLKKKKGRLGTVKRNQ